LIALSVTPFLFAVVYTYTRRIKQASRDLRKKEGEVVSVVAEVLNSIRVVKAFAREDYEEAVSHSKASRMSRLRSRRAVFQRKSEPQITQIGFD
jgi:subfamily B ATP-binding cassette protein MsbA